MSIIHSGTNQLRVPGLTTKSQVIILNFFKRHHSTTKPRCCSFLFNEVTVPFGAPLFGCPDIMLINSWNLDFDGEKALIFFHFSNFLCVAVKKLNILRPQILALGSSHFSTAAEPSSSKRNPPVSSASHLGSWFIGFC